MNLYNSRYYQWQSIGASKSSRVIVPLVTSFVEPKSVIGVGCGVGAWLKTFADGGIKDYLGIDGSYIDRSKLLIPRKYFIAKDLSRPLGLKRRFDLAICLEVIEHIPPSKSGQLVKSPTKLSDCVMFSGAVPFQGGTDHKNERWQSYWIAKFKKYNYIAVDALRPKIWNNQLVDWWYRQNTLLLVKDTALKNYPQLAHAYALQAYTIVDIVHPQKYLMVANPKYWSPLQIIFSFPRSVINSFRQKWS